MSLYPAAVPHTLAALPGGNEGIRTTLKHMVRFVRKYKSDAGIRTLAVELTKDLPSKDYAAEVHTLFNWVKSNIRYVRDVQGVETLQTPKETLRQHSGDCDDQSMLLAALLCSIDHPVRFIALGFKGAPFSHVLVQTKIGDRWVPLDTTVEYSYVGWFPPGATTFMVARV